MKFIFSILLVIMALIAAFAGTSQVIEENIFHVKNKIKNGIFCSFLRLNQDVDLEDSVVSVVDSVDLEDSVVSVEDSVDLDVAEEDFLDREQISYVRLMLKQSNNFLISHSLLSGFNKIIRVNSNFSRVFKSIII